MSHMTHPLPSWLAQAWDTWPKLTNQIPLLGIWNWAIQPVNSGKQSRGKVETGSEWEPHGSQNNGGAEKPWISRESWSTETMEQPQGEQRRQENMRLQGERWRERAAAWEVDGFPVPGSSPRASCLHILPVRFLLTSLLSPFLELCLVGFYSLSPGSLTQLERRWHFLYETQLWLRGSGLRSTDGTWGWTKPRHPTVCKFAFDLSLACLCLLFKVDRQKPSVRCCTGGGPGELEAPLHRPFFLTVLGVRKPVELFQGRFGCGTEWKGHRLWRQAAIIHLFEPRFFHLWNGIVEGSTAVFWGKYSETWPWQGCTSLEGTGSCCFCCLRKPSASSSQRMWPGTELAVGRPPVLGGPGFLPQVTFTLLLTPYSLFHYFPLLLSIPFFSVILDADKNICFRKAAGLNIKLLISLYTVRRQTGRTGSESWLISPCLLCASGRIPTSLWTLSLLSIK